MTPITARDFRALAHPDPAMDAILKTAGNAPVEELPALIGVCHQAAAVAQLRLAAPRPAESSSASRWLTPDEAAQLAGVPVRRVYRWAAGKPWAKRPTRRTLRVEESGFRRWLNAA